MTLKEFKISADEIGSKGVVAAPDKLRGSAKENKELFDRLVRELVAEKLNGLVDAIVEELAGKMAAPESEGVPGQYLRIGESGMEWGVPAGSGDMIEAVYDTNGDGVVDEADSARSCTGNAATATKLRTARTLTVQDASGSNKGSSKSFDGSGNVTLSLPSKIKANIEGDVSGNVSGNVTGSAGSAGSCTGNAATATKLQTARKIGEASFNGASDITLAAMGVTKAANINVAANTLAAFTARRIYIGTAAPSASAGAVGDLWVEI